MAGKLHCPFSQSELITLYQKCGTIKDLAKKVGISPATAKRWCEALGVKTRGRGETEYKGWHKDTEYPERRKTANVSKLQQADPRSFIEMANEILTGERAFAPVGIGRK